MFRVMMTIDGQEVPSSCVKTGPRNQCEASARRLLRQKDRSARIGWIVLPCIN